MRISRFSDAVSAGFSRCRAHGRLLAEGKVKIRRYRAAPPYTFADYLPRLKRLLKRSTRPPVSTSFCLPVKKGWHLEQISTRISGTVEMVSSVLPQAQRITAGPYLGWMPFFMRFHLFRIPGANVSLHWLNRTEIVYHNARQIARKKCKKFWRKKWKNYRIYRVT